MTTARVIKILGGGTAAIAILLGLSYAEEAPKYRFERLAVTTGQQIPGARLVSTVKTGDLVSPISWFRPTSTIWNFATPDPFMGGRFYLVSLSYDRESPDVYLIDIDCVARDGEWFDLDEPDTAFPARTRGGDPVTVSDGKTYRRMKTNIAIPPEWLRAFCDTDWTIEREATHAAMVKTAPK